MKPVNIALITAILTYLAASLLQAAEQAPMVRNMGNVRGGDVREAHRIIEKKCTACHSSQLIDAALASSKDMLRIQREMEKRGASLNANERNVLGIYWKQQNPLKQAK